MDEERIKALPDGQEIESQVRPVIGVAHTSRLRKLWAFGRPVHVGQLSGMDLDLMVCGLVETVDKAYGGTAVLTVTKRGVAHLSDARQRLIACQRPHHEIGKRLIKHLHGKGMHTWENVAFSNPDATIERRWSVVRPDVYACLPSLKAENAATSIYEVKANRADFLADLAKTEKREAYAQLAEAVYYCCPTGMVEKDEVPDGYGLLVEAEDGVFKLVKKAKRQKSFVLAVNTAMTLMVKRQMPLGESEDAEG